MTDKTNNVLQSRSKNITIYLQVTLLFLLIFLFELLYNCTTCGLNACQNRKPLNTLFIFQFQSGRFITTKFVIKLVLISYSLLFCFVVMLSPLGNLFYYWAENCTAPLQNTLELDGRGQEKINLKRWVRKSMQ